MILETVAAVLYLAELGYKFDYKLVQKVRKPRNK
jgi:hypothetical protein